MIHYIIPARKNSKDIPLKNRILFKYTANIIPKNLCKKIIVSTNDNEIIKLASKYKFNTHKRSEINSSDIASTKDFLIEIIEDMNLSGQICMLYLTYPQRKWSDVVNAIKFFKDQKASSLLCREEIKTHPYVCLYEHEKFKGKQIVKHDLCRRQDYPKCFKICHNIAIFNCKEIHNLNSNIYNDDTIYFPIKTSLDIDTPLDLCKFKPSNIG